LEWWSIEKTEPLYRLVETPRLINTPSLQYSITPMPFTPIDGDR
jgi:hypothetical protein